MLWNYVSDNGLEDDGVTLDRFAGFNNERQDSYSLDNQLQAVFETGAVRHRVLLGADYSRMHFIDFEGYGDAPPLDLRSPQYATGPIPVPDVGSVTNQTQSQIGVYFQDQLKLSQWILTIGGRRDHAKSDTGDVLDATVESQTDSHFSGRAGLGYAVTDKLIPYVSYSTSFQLTPE